MLTDLTDIRNILSRRRLPALDGLRAVAVLTVMVYHFGFASVPGDLGVTAFFVISGFLITWLLLREYERTDTVSLRSFYMRRVLRIFPAYYAFIAITFAIDFWRKDIWTPGLTGSALGYVMNYYNALHGHPSTSVAHAWSLAVEEQFYLLWPLTFLVLARRGRKTIAGALVVLILLVCGWRSYLYIARGVGSAYVYNAFDTRFDELAIGCLLAVVAGSAWFSSGVRMVTCRAWLPLVTLALLLTSRTGGSARYHYGPGFTIDALLVATFIVQMLVLHRQWLWAWLEHPVVRFVGTISYPLYLYQLWGLDVGHRARFLPIGGELLVGLAASGILASGSYYVIERPFLSMKRRFERFVTPVAAPVVPAGSYRAAAGMFDEERITARER